MILRVQDPESGQLFELPTASIEAGKTTNPTTSSAAAFDTDNDQVLTLKDRPANVGEGEWRAYLTHLAGWARLHPAAAEAVSALRSAEAPLLKVTADIRRRLEQAVTKDRLTALADALAADGITIEKTGATIRGEGPVHRLVRSGQPEAFLAFHDGVPTEHVLLRARLATGVLPEAARGFAASLAAGESDKLVRLFARATIRPEEVEYDRDNGRLFAAVTELALEGAELVVRFGDDRGDGPGVLRIANLDGQLQASVTFEYYGSSAIKLALE